MGNKNDKIEPSGELSERFKELVLKTSDSERNLGFESLTLRQKYSPPFGWGVFLLELGIRKAGPTEGGVKKCPGDTFLGRGRVHRRKTHPVGVEAFFYNVQTREGF